MMKFIELFDGFRYKLQNISYNTIESDDEEERELQISYKDSYDIVDSNNDVLVIDFCRKIITSDDILFDLSITYRIEHFVNKELIPSIFPNKILSSLLYSTLALYPLYSKILLINVTTFF